MMPGTLKTLLNGLIDYAGLFPPAKLDLETALTNYVRYKGGEESWLVARFVIPATQLCDVAPLLSTAGPHRFSALLNADALDESLSAVSEFNTQNIGRLTVDSVELKPARSSVSDTVNRIGSVISNAEIFVEVELSDDVCSAIAEVAESGNAKVKFRTGGVTEDAFPSVEQLATGIAACATLGVPMKATAGLHHPVRHFNESVNTKMHGFLNVFCAACFAYELRLEAEALAPILGCEECSKFSFSDSEMCFGTHCLSNERIAAARSKALSFGSCSIEEPVDDLKSLGCW